MTIQQLKAAAGVTTIDFRQSNANPNNLVAKNLEQRVMTTQTVVEAISKDANTELEVNTDQNGVFWLNLSSATIFSI